MRTLKKTLALVLVVALVLSFSAIGANAFTDSSKITKSYAEAVDVLTGIKVIDGLDDGSFNPAGTLTRAQAAKIIAFVKLGPTNAKLVSGATAQKFSDVPTSHWAAGYIEYCANLKIVEGVDDKNFDPEGKLTTAAFTKMLLVAVGMDGAKFSGDSWALNVATAALTAGIYDETIGVSATAEISREQACQLAFLALNYSSNGTGEKIWTITGISGSTVTYGWVTVPGTATDSLAAKVFKLASVSATTDAGLTGHKWQASSKDITGIYVDDTLVASFPAGTTYGAIASKLGVTASFAKTAKWFANGVEKQSFTAAQLITFVGDTTHTINAPVDIYKDADGNYKLMATYEYLGKVKSVTKLSGLNAGLDQVVFTVFDSDTGYDVTLGAEAKIATGTYKAGDLYVVVPKGDNHSATSFLSITAAKTVDGKVTGTGTGYVRVDGTKYVAGQYVKVFNALDYNTSTFTFYLDSVGNMIGYSLKTAAAAAAFDGILYLTTAQAKVTGASSSLYGDVAYSASAKANVYFAGEAAAKVIDLAIYTTYNTTTGAVTGTYVGKNTTGWPITNGYDTAKEIGSVAGWYGYNSTASGYVLTAIADSKNADVTLLKGSAAVISGKYADANTVVTVYNYDAVAKNVTKTAYTGIAGYPTTAKTYLDNANLIVVTYVAKTDGTDSNVVKTIDIFTNVNTVTTTAVTYAYYVGAGEAYATGSYYQGFYVKGEYVEYKVAGTLTLEAGNVYGITIDADGKLSAANKVIDKYVAATPATYMTVDYVGSTYVVLGGHIYYYATTFAAYNVETGKGAAATLAVGDKVIVKTETVSSVDYINVAYVVAAA